MNKVREGYKMTEIGEIPEEWEVSEIGRYIENISKKNKDLNIQHVVSVTKYNGIVDSLEYFDKQVFSKDISNYKIIKKDEFAYSTIHLNEGAIGYLKHCENAVLSPMYTVFKVRNDLVNNYFLYNLLKSNKYINIYEMLGEGSVDRRSSIPFNKFKEIKVAMPPIEEQEKISSILSTVDEQIDNVDALIEKNKELKKGLMQTLLTKGIGHTKFKKTEIGEIPEEWEVRRLEDICDDITIGMVKTMTKFYVDNGVPLIRNSDIKENTIKTDSMVYLDKEFSRANQSKCLNIGQIVTVHTGDIGTSAVIEENMQGAQGFATLNTTVNKSIINEYYLCWYLNSDICKNQAYSFSTGDGRNNLNLKDFVNILAIVPSSIEEQKKIVFILNSISRKIQEYENKKQKLEELKKGLMQQLLSGKIRVK